MHISVIARISYIDEGSGLNTSASTEVAEIQPGAMDVAEV
jgi:hypothetical protein